MLRDFRANWWTLTILRRVVLHWCNLQTQARPGKALFWRIWRGMVLRLRIHAYTTLLKRSAVTTPLAHSNSTYKLIICKLGEQVSVIYIPASEWVNLWFPSSLDCCLYFEDTIDSSLVSSRKPFILSRMVLWPEFWLTQLGRIKWTHLSLESMIPPYVWYPTVTFMVSYRTLEVAPC